MRIFHIHYYGKSAMDVCKILYNNSNNSIRLERKFKIWEKWT